MITNTKQYRNCLKMLLCDVFFQQKISLKWSECKTKVILKINNIDLAVFKKHYDESFWRDLYLPNKQPPQGVLFLKHIGYESIEDFLNFFNNDFQGIIKDILFKGTSRNII